MNRLAEQNQAKRSPKPQTPACDRCTVGVMDATNPHLWGDCPCPCHTAHNERKKRSAPKGAPGEVTATRLRSPRAGRSTDHNERSRREA